MKKATLIFVLVGTFLFNTVNAQTKTTKDPDSKNPKSNDPKVEQTSTGTQTSADKASLETKAQEMAKEMTTKMDEVLNLNPDQEKKAMAANLKYSREILQLKMKSQNNPNADKTAMEAERNELQEAKMKEYKSFLNKDQIAKFNEHRGSMKGEKEGMSKEEKKEKMENMTPEEKEEMKKKKEDKEKKSH